MFDQPAAEGYLITAAGSGTRVAPSTAARDALRRPKRDDRTRPAPIEVDFEYGIPDLLSFPMQGWLPGRAFRRLRYPSTKRA